MTRNSSFELLRIILIIMILVEHGNMWFVGSGFTSESEHLAKCIVESVCIGSVNAFVLISGWFGIRRGLQKAPSLIFMLLFCTVPLLVLALILGWLPTASVASLEGVYEYLLGGNSYWFVIDYIGLLIIAPILNEAIKTLDRRRLKTLLASGYAIILIYDFIFRAPVLGTEGGYSVIWFGFLYLLARYMRLYGSELLDRHCVLLLIASVTAQAVLFYFGFIGMRYTNPLILAEAVSLIFIFRKWNFHTRAINYAATGCLMAYLLHMQPVLIPYIRRFLITEYTTYGYWFYITEVLGLSIGVFLTAIMLDKMQSSLRRQIVKCWSR